MLAISSRHRGFFVGAILFAAALILRVAHLATMRSSPYFHRLWLDLEFFDDWGMQIASGHAWGAGHFYQDPLYPYFLGCLYAIFGHSTSTAIVIQLVLGSTVPVILYLAVRKGAGEREAIAAGAIAAIYVPSIFYEGLLLKSWMDVFLVSVAIAVLAHAASDRSRRSWMIAGLIFGIACLDRGNLILVAPALAVWLVLDPAPGDRAGGPRARFVLAAAFLAGAAVVLGASAARNRIAGGEWILTTAQAGQNFYLGNNPEAKTGGFDPPPFLRSNPKHEEGDFAAEARRRTGVEMTPGERSSFWFRQGMAWVRQNPGAWAARTLLKLRRFFSAYEIPDNIDFYVYRRWAPVLRLPLPGFGAVAPLALAGAFVAWKRSGWPRSLVVMLGVYVASVVLFFVLSRYRLAAMPMLFALAGVGGVALWDRARDAARGGPVRPFVLTALGWAACAAMVNLPVRLPPDEPLFRFAVAAGLPTHAESDSHEYFNLGLIYAKDGDLPRAEDAFRRAQAGDPDRIDIIVELGKVVARAGRTQEAIDLFGRASTLEPRSPVPHHALGLLYRRLGRTEDAEAELRKESELQSAGDRSPMRP